MILAILINFKNFGSFILELLKIESQQVNFNLEKKDKKNKFKFEVTVFNARQKRKPKLNFKLTVNSGTQRKSEYLKIK